jgi:hypothetical protein
VTFAIRTTAKVAFFGSAVGAGPAPRHGLPLHTHVKAPGRMCPGLGQALRWPQLLMPGYWFELSKSTWIPESFYQNSVRF